MNCIILEGVTLYIVIAIVTALVLISLGCIFCAMLLDKRTVIYEKLLCYEHKKNKKLTKENFVLKMKCGEFEINES